MEAEEGAARVGMKPTLERCMPGWERRGRLLDFGTPLLDEKEEADEEEGAAGLEKIGCADSAETETFDKAGGTTLAGAAVYVEDE